MKELLLLCTKNVHFTFNNEICQQCDGLAMRSTLGLVIAGIFMVELEKPLTPTLLQHMSPWKQYVDDTIGVIKLSSIEHVLSILNSFHQNIEFTYELERNGRTNNTLQTTIYRKSTHNGVYLHWNSFAPRTWKRGKLRTILIRAYKICSSKELLQSELEQIEEEFTKINGYPKWVFDQANEECRVPRNGDYDNNVTANNEYIITTHRLVLPYKGEQGQKIIKSVNNYVKRLLPQNHTAQNVYKNRKLGSAFDIKDQTKLEHKHDLTYLVKCLENTYSETYLGKTGRRLKERILEHAGKDNKSHVLNLQSSRLFNLVIHQYLQTILEYFRKNITAAK